MRLQQGAIAIPYTTQHDRKLDRKTLVDNTSILYRIPDKNRRVMMVATLIGQYNATLNTQYALRYMDRHHQQGSTDSLQHIFSNTRVANKQTRD